MPTYKFLKQFAVKPGDSVDLGEYDASFTGGFEKDLAKQIVQSNAAVLADQQYLMYAENKRALLIILQGMDTSGKDGVIRHVISGFNPQGCNVTAFKAPSAQEMAHDFLWRIHKAVPPRGEIGIFNRSQYEDVLIVRVKNLVPKAVWKERYEQINRFEKILSDNGVVIRKFYLHISKKEQKDRLEARLKKPEKMWKFSKNDLIERELWDDYTKAYEKALSVCSTPWAPWFIIPANKKWFRDLAISEILKETLIGMDLRMPKPPDGIRNIKVV